MGKKGTMFYQAILLTGANLLLRMVSLGFQVYLSGRVGAAGIGLLQLTLSVCSFGLTAAMGGIRTATMYLTAAELGKGRTGAQGKVLSSCYLYSILCSSFVCVLVYLFAPTIAAVWIGDGRVLPAIRIFAAFLPVTCLVGVLTGYYTAAGRVKALVCIEVAEQLVSMGATVILLMLFGKNDPGASCACIIGGSCAAGLVSLLCLLLFKGKAPNRTAEKTSMMKRLLPVAVPLAFADIFRMGISTVENLIVPRRLALFSGSERALASYGEVCGMVFPVLMFPASILYSLAELLIPELSRCAAGGRQKRTSYLTARSLRVAYVYGLGAGGLLFTLAQGLGVLLYSNPEVGQLLKLYALLVPMLYTDAITDAVIKGMGQQVASVRYNTLTSFLDVVFLWVLLPQMGLRGYYLSFVATHAINFYLSVRRLSKVTGCKPSLPGILRGLPPWLGSMAVCLLLPAAETVGQAVFFGGIYLLIFLLSAALSGLLRREDLRWLRGLIRGS